MKARRVALVLAVCLAAGGIVAAYQAPPGPRSLRHFNPDRMASLETDMWKAYYAKEKVRLFTLLVQQLREQSRYRWVDAVRVGFYLARAAGDFSDLRNDYDQVLPDLTEGYRITRDWVGASFEPRQLAEAELAWWVARRIPGQNAPEQVGELMARAYAQLYEAPVTDVQTAALLRARAGALRDAGGVNADWPEVERMLRDSYRSLHEALSGQK